MGKTTVEQNSNKYVVVNKLVDPEAINERELNAIAGGLLENLIPVSAEKGKKGIVIKSSIVGMMSLHSYFSAIVSKKMFLDTVSQIIRIVKECETSLMNVNNLMLDWEYIFLDPRTKKVKCIFWPVVNNQSAVNMTSFFNDLPFRVVFTQHENHEYITHYLDYFKIHTPFSINSFERLIFEMMGKTIENKSHIPSSSADLNSSSQQISEEIDRNKGNIAYNPLKTPESGFSNICPSCANVCGDEDAYCSKCGTPLRVVETFKQKVVDISEVLGLKEDEEGLNETTVLGGEEFCGTTVLGVYEEPTYPYLIREKTEEKIIVDKPSFRIGKEGRYCDYFVLDNNAVSRSHADILTKEDRYYIVDNNSTNKTFVEGRAIPAQKEIEIFSGTKLRLANEDFTFYI